MRDFEVPEERFVDGDEGEVVLEVQLGAEEVPLLEILIICLPHKFILFRFFFLKTYIFYSF